jgi:hypothetical protein
MSESLIIHAQISSVDAGESGYTHHFQILGNSSSPKPVLSASPIVSIHHFIIQIAWISASEWLSPPTNGPSSCARRKPCSAPCKNARSSDLALSCKMPKSSRAKTGNSAARSLASSAVTNSAGKQGRVSQKLLCSRRKSRQ